MSHISTVVELVDVAYADGEATPRKVQAVLVNGTPVQVLRDGIDVDHGNDHDCVVVTLKLLASRVEIRGYRDTDKRWMTAPNSE